MSNLKSGGLRWKKFAQLNANETNCQQFVLKLITVNFRQKL